MNSKLKLSTLLSLVLIAFFAINATVVSAQSCPSGNTTLTVNGSTANDNDVKVTFNNGNGYQISMETMYWRADIKFNDITLNKSDYLVGDGKSDPGPGQGTVVVTNTFNNMVYYSNDGIEPLTACKDANGVITVSFNMTLNSKSNAAAKVSGFVRYNPN